MAQRKKDYGKPTIFSSMSEVHSGKTEEEREAHWQSIFGKKEPKDDNSEEPNSDN